MVKKILVACGTAIATSTVVAKKIESVLKEKGIDVIVEQCRASEVPYKKNGVSLIVTTTPISDPGDIPVIQTLSFLTGVGIDADLEKILNYLK